MTIKLPGYKIIRTLGKGGMATVYLAEQEIFEREVALKVMSKSLAEDPSFGQRFMREARIVSQLVHPNIVTVHDVGVHEGYYFLSMQVIDGEDLKQSRRKLSIRQKIVAIRDIAKALDYAGSKGYVHRDIKPENILFHTSDGRAVLTDFGIARAAESDLAMTQTGTAIGTPHYMSPEQAKGLAVDHRADLYSLGVVLYLLIANRLPFDAESAVAIGIKHITEKIPALPVEFSGLQPLINKLMAKKVENRFQTAKELIEALDELDMLQLEHVERMAAEALSHRTQAGDPDAPTQVAVGITDTVTAPTIARSVLEDERMTAAELSEDESASGDTDEYTVVFEEEEPKGSWFPWVAGFLVLAAVSGAVFYQQRPDVAKTWFDQGLTYVDDVSAGVADWLFSDGVSTEVVPSEPSLSASGPEESEASSVIAPVAEKNVELESSAPLTPATDTPEEVSADVAATPELVNLLAKLEQLETHYQMEPAVLPELVEAYSKLLLLKPEDKVLQENFNALRQGEEDKILTLVADEKVDAARKRLEQYSAVFAGASQQEILDLETRLERQVEINSLLAQAATYFEANALTRPESENALDVYKRILELDETNVLAQQGMVRVAEKLVGYAQKSVQKGSLSSASTHINKALAIAPNLGSAQSEQRRIKRLIETQKDIEQRVASGDKALADGDYFTPAMASAYAHYRAALSIDKNALEAKAGIESTLKSFRGRIDGLLDEEDFDLVRALLKRALADSSDYTALQRLEEEVELRIAELIYAKQPRIVHLVVAGQPISDHAASQEGSIKADRSIYIGFKFENFQSETAVIQAELTDGTGSLQIAQVPVIVTGEKGVAEFSIDRAVEGFPSGSYTVIMRLDDLTLFETLIRVSN